MQNNFFDIQLHRIVQSPGTEIPYQSNRLVTPFLPCKNLKSYLTDVIYSEEDLENSLCGDFSQEFEFGGSFEKEETVSFLEILLTPCKVISPGDCQVQHNGSLKNTREDPTVIDEYFRDFKLEVSYIESKQDAQNFEKPLLKHFGSLEF